MWQMRLQALTDRKLKGEDIMSKYKRYYQKRQNQLREQAIEWQMKFSDGEVMYWSDIAEAGDYFRYWGKRFGLLREFRENAII